MAPAGGPPLQRRLRWRLEGAAAAAAVAVLRRLSPEAASAVAAAVCALIGPHTAKGAKARDNLRFVVPHADRRELDRLVRGLFASLGRAAAELVLLERLWRERTQRLVFEADPAAAEAVARGGPAVFVTAHVGAWQLGSLIGAHYGLPFAAVYTPESNPHLERLLARLRQGFRAEPIASRGGVRKLLALLRAGCSVGLAVDTRLDAGALIPFFGVPAPTNTVPARLALACRCPLVPVRAERLAGGRYRIRLEAPIAPPSGEADSRAAAEQMTAALNARFEAWIAADPRQWVCLKRRWPKGAAPGPLPAAGGPRQGPPPE
ncbi:MAG: hypothetical protein KatS3mg124_0351 [Porticoccaceae bacterium]|nr:MAG: hypothetical protein KatS3mg124_0351 [Porticoccaceae bacterium]